MSLQRDSARLVVLTLCAAFAFGADVAPPPEDPARTVTRPCRERLGHAATATTDLLRQHQPVADPHDDVTGVIDRNCGGA